MTPSNETLAALEFSVVRGLLAERTVTPMGGSLARSLEPLPTEEAITAGLDETDEAVRLLEAEGALPLRGAEGVEEVLARVRPEGTVLSGVEILAVTRFCAVVEDLRACRERLREPCPLLAERAGRLPDLRAIVRTIQGKISPAGELEDSASPDLARVRGRIQAARTSLRARLEAILSRADAEKVLSDSFITERGGRFVIPVRSDSPIPVRGIVHGGSSSGATLFVEPLATVEMNNELVRLRENEAAETERILRGWSERIRERREEMLEAAGEVGRLDLAQAKGYLARDLRAVRPALVGGGGVALAGARHPLLERALAAAGRRMVPIDLTLPPGSSTMIVSGSNAGGKTVVLKTVGLLALMAHAGLRVPAEEARLPFLRGVLVDIGDRQSIEGSLSTFSAHVQNLSDIVDHLAPPCLVLIDEIGTGTDPVDGGALAIALLEWLRGHGALTVATTHHGPVKVYGIETPGVESAAVEFDEATLAPTYRLLQGIAGASSGLAIAERLGLDATIVEDAKRRIAPAEREAESYLRRLKELVTDLQEDRRELEGLRLRLHEEARRVREEAIRSDHERAEKFRGELAAALEEFRTRAREHLQGVADKKETIRLEKERARREAELRREAEALTRRGAPAEPLPPGMRRGEGARRGRGRGGAGKGSGGESRELEGAGAESQGGPEEPFHPAPGARVVVGPYGREGRIERIDGGNATVLVGSARFRVPLEECLPPGAQEHPGPPVTRMTPRPLPAGRTLGKEGAAREVNLIGYTVEEGMELLDKFLDDAFLAGHREVRVVHGHGTGRLRRAVRDLLAGHPQVSSHRPGNPNEGGEGATVALLNE